MRETLIQTDRLRLRHLDDDDASFILALLNEPAYLRWIGDKGVRNLDDAVAYIRGYALDTWERHGFGPMAVELRESGEPVGVCGLLRRDALDAPDLGYAFLEAHHGRGYGGEAARAALDHATGQLGIRRLVAITAPDHEASMALLRRLGFRRAGTARLADDGPDLNLFERTADPGGIGG